MKTLPESIAAEIMDTIERERRINKDDLVLAAERAIQRHTAEFSKLHPVKVVGDSGLTVDSSKFKDWKQIQDLTKGKFDPDEIGRKLLPGFYDKIRTLTSKSADKRGVDPASITWLGTPSPDEIRKWRDRVERTACHIFNNDFSSDRCISAVNTPAHTHTITTVSDENSLTLTAPGSGTGGVQAINPPKTMTWSDPKHLKQPEECHMHSDGKHIWERRYDAPMDQYYGECRCGAVTKSA